jgi:hypothetical protein
MRKIKYLTVVYSSEHPDFEKISAAAETGAALREFYREAL